MSEMRRYLKKKKYELIPGTLVECASGRYLAFYEHRTDIIANGENEVDAKTNLREMYKIVMEHEDETVEKKTVVLPPNSKSKSFKEKIECL